MLRGVAVLVLGVLALSACTGSSDSTTAPSTQAGPAITASTPVATSIPVETTQPSTSQADALDGCELVTQAEAEVLFGQPVSMPPDQIGGLPGQLGVCIWQAEGGALLTISVFEGEEFFGAVGQLEGSEEIALGDGGHRFVESPFLGVQIQWLHDGLTVTLNGDTLGIDDTATFETDMSALAETVEGRLP